MSSPSRVWSHAAPAALTRYIAKVRTVDVADVECWVWVGGIESTAGYGRFQAGPGRVVAAHRWSWWAATGEWPPAHLVVRHACDVRCCVNPDHLSIGTAADNVADMVARHRGSNVSTGRNRGLARSRSIREAAIAGDTTRLRALLVEPTQLALALTGDDLETVQLTPTS